MSLSSLRSRLHYWDDQVKDLKNKIKKLKKRKKDIESAKNSLKSVTNGNTKDVNSKLSSSAKSLRNAINYSVKNNKLDTILLGKNERILGSDINLTSSDDELQRELNDVNAKIEEAENSLDYAKREVNDLETAIQTEKRRLKRKKAAEKAAENASKNR